MTSATIDGPHAPDGQIPRGTAPFEPAAGPPENPASGLFASIVARGSELLSSDGERERTQRSALLAFAVRCVSAALLYLSQIVLARWMGGEEYGIYVFVWTWVLILGGLSHAGLNLAAMRLAPTYRESGAYDKLRGLLRGIRFAALGAGTLVMLAGMGGLYLFGHQIETHFVLPLYLALVCVPLFALTDVQDGIGRAHGWMGVALLPPYVLRPLLVLVSMIAAHWLGFPMQAATAAGAAIVATWGAAAIQTLVLNRQLSAVLPNGTRDYDMKPWFTASLPLTAILGSELLLQNADVLVIARYLSPADAGVYFASAKTMALIMFVHYAVGSAVAHRFAALHARGDQASLRAFVKDAVNWTFWPSLAGALIILALGKPLLALFGPGFAAGYPVMCVLVVGFLFRSAMGPAEYLLNMLGEQALCAKVMLASAAIAVGLNVWLVPRYGLEGAAIATASALVMSALMQSIAVWRRLEIEIAIWRNLPALNAQART